MEERLGAVYSLEHVLVESPQDHLTIVNLLANFVRHRTLPPGFPDGFSRPRSTNDPLPTFGTEPDADVEAALRVLAVRPKRPEPFRIDLRHASLPGLYLRDFEFSSKPSLALAFFTWSDLRRASLEGVNLSRSIFVEADMRRCNLGRANLEGASLSRADLRGARMLDARLVGANLDGADLRDCTDLTPTQLAGAMINETTKLPPHLVNDEWVSARLAACRPYEDRRNVPPATPQPGSS
ncbi:pentapeptide repeat-containing protein [Actinacidiphila glaucinigra]